MYKSEVIIAFRPTDLPWPVAPATRRCGILARSKARASLDIVLPRTIGSSKPELRNLSSRSIDFKGTTLGLELATSIPTLFVPGIGAIIRTPLAASDIAISSSRRLIWEILTPADGVISYMVTVGPVRAVILSIPIL